MRLGGGRGPFNFIRFPLMEGTLIRLITVRNAVFSFSDFRKFVERENAPKLIIWH